MNRRTKRHLKVVSVGAVAALATAFVAVPSASPSMTKDERTSLRPGAVFAMSNEASGNRITAFSRATDGTLSPAGDFATGGTGSGVFENTANGLILGDDTSPNNVGNSSRFLFTVNSGSDDITVFEIQPDGLQKVDLEASGGNTPVSLTVNKNVLYVLNAGADECTGGAPNITGFDIGSNGDLTPIPGSTRPVAGGENSGCAQVSFNPSGDVLVVTERQSDTISTYTVKNNIAEGPIRNETSGNGPFGFTFTQRGQLVTTENFGGAAFQGGAASYEVNDDGTLEVISPTVRNGRSDTCWVVITDNQKFAFITNFQSGDISSYRVNPDGTIELLNPIAASVGVAGASDETLSQDSRFLYVRNTVEGTITAFEVGNDGSLTQIQRLGGLNPGFVATGIAGI